MELEESRFYTVEEIAAILRTHVQTVRRWIRAGRLPVLRMERRYRVRGADILAMIGKLEREASQGQK